MEVLEVRRNGEEDTVSVELVRLEDLDVEALEDGSSLNLLVASQIEDPELLGLMFGPLGEGEAIYLCPPDINWPRLLSHLKCFPTPSGAAKSLKKEKKSLDIQKGFHTFKMGEDKEVSLHIWKPMHGSWL